MSILEKKKDLKLQLEVLLRKLDKGQQFKPKKKAEEKRL
jgi:hypothetical protein